MSDVGNTELPTTIDESGIEYEKFDKTETHVDKLDKEDKEVKNEEDVIELEEDLAKPVSFFRLFRYADTFDRILILIGVIAACAVGTAFPLFSVILGDLFDGIAIEPGEEDENFFRDQAREPVILFAALSGSVFVLGFFQTACFTISAERQTLRIREAYLRAVLNQEIAWFDQRLSGELSAKIAENTVVIREALSDKLGGLFQFGFTFIASFGVGIYINYELALILCVSIPLIAVGGFCLMSAIGEMNSDGLGAYTKAGSLVEETLVNIRTVTAFNSQHRILGRYEKYLDIAESAGLKRSMRMGCGLGFVLFIMFLTYSLGFFYGALLIEEDRIEAFTLFPNGDAECTAQAELFGLEETDFCASAEIILFGLELECPCGCSNPDADCLSGGDVVLVFFAIVIGGFSLGQAAPSLSALLNGRISAGKIYSVINRTPAIISHPPTDDDRRDFPKLSGKVVFDNITFAYPTRPDVKIFNGLKLTIPEGRSTALVGGSGCGKSTVMQLLQRFYDPHAGAVLISGEDGSEHDLRDLNLSLFRNEIGLVAQEPVLFATTIFKNIAYGAKFGHVPTLEEVHAAAQAANAYDFIDEFPDKFDTMVGEQGAQLSGGQRQRIAIARAILRDPSFLLLDEATSALDNVSERIVQDALDKLLEKSARTTIVIAHRLSTVRNCDKIVVLGEGGVLEEGTHDSLLDMQDGVYSMLVNAANQTQEKNSGDVNLNNVLEEKAIEGDTRAVRALSNASGRAKEMNAVTFVDPADVKAQLDKDEQADGDEKKEEEEEELYKVPISRVFSLVKDERCWFVPAIIGAMLAGAQMPLFAILIADIITALFEVDSEDLRDEANRFAVLFIGLSVAAFLSNFTMNYCFGYIAEKLTKRVRMILFSSLLTQEIGFFDMEENSVGALASQLSTDAALVKAVIADRIGLLVMNMTTIILGFGIAFYNGWELTLVMFGLMPLIIIGALFEMMAYANAAGGESKDLGTASQVLQESIAGIRTVTAFNAKDRVVNLFTEYLEGPRKKARKKGIILGLGFGFSQCVLFAMYAIAFYVGSIFIDKGIFDFNQLLTVFFAVMMTGMGLGQAAAMAPDAAKGGLAVSSVFKLVDRVSQINPDSNEGDVQENTKEFGFMVKGANFRYPARPEVQVLKELDLDITPGSTVALVGTSGSGKSTIISLVQRFYDPEDGDISLQDGSSLPTLNLRWWREQIGLVEQEPRLFATTIKENIRFGVPLDKEVTDEEIMDAARASNAHDFIMSFPDGYDTLVGDKGAQLSGGQKQRICIARAIIRKPKVLLLDEATSALDNKSERIVQEALDNLLEQTNMTTIVIAHRLTTIQNADKIVVMAYGEVIESGTHDELLQAGGQYFKLWNTQLEH